jgi:hypothetical protein
MISTMETTFALEWFEGTGSQRRAITYAQTNDHRSVVQTDVMYRGCTNPSKKYASYPSHLYLVHELLSRYENNVPCVLYEIIQNDHPARVYMDCEWYEKDQASADRRLIKLLSEMKPDYEATHGFTPKFAVTDSSRVTDKGKKWSYHVTITNAAFSSNVGSMKYYFVDFMEQRRHVPELWCDGEFIVDLKVYTTGRPMRTALSSKMNDETNQKLIPCTYNGDTWVPIAITCKEQLLDYLITYIPEDVHMLPDIAHIERPTNHGAARTAPTKKRKLDSDPTSIIDKPLPQLQTIPLNLQEEINLKLASIGLTHRVKGELRHGCIMDLRSGAMRRCPLLHSHEEDHKSNNQYLRMDEAGVLHFCCYSGRCKGKSRKLELLSTDLLQQMQTNPETIECVEIPDDVVIDTPTPEVGADQPKTKKTKTVDEPTTNENPVDHREEEIKFSQIEIVEECKDYSQDFEYPRTDCYKNNRYFYISENLKLLICVSSESISIREFVPTSNSLETVV